MARRSTAVAATQLPMHWMLHSVATMSLAVPMACTGITEPGLPAAERFNALPQYIRWWREMEVCSAHVGPLGGVSFYRVVPTPGRDSLQFMDPESGEYRDGEWVGRRNAIYLAAGRVTDAGLVRHEMLHALLRDVHHPPRYFEGRCAQLVKY